MENTYYFDFEKYRTEQVKCTGRIVRIQHPRDEFVNNLVIFTRSGLVNHDRTYKANSRCFMNFLIPEVDKFAPQEYLNIYADYDQKGFIIRIFAWHPDIIPFWGENKKISIIQNCTNDIAIAADNSIVDHRASSRVLQKLIDKNYYPYFCDPVKYKSRYIAFRVDRNCSDSDNRIENFYIHKYNYCSDYNAVFYSSAFEIYMLPEEVYFSYRGL